MSQAGTFGSNGVFPPGTVVQTLSGNDMIPVGPDGVNNINIVGTGDVTVTGNPGTNTLDISLSGALASEYDANTGTAIPALGILNIVGSGGVTTTGAGNTITINAAAPVALTFTEDVGTATESAGNINILGSHGINTAGATDIVTIAIDNAITLGDLAPIGAGIDALTLTTGDASIVAGNLNLPTTANANTGVIEVNSIRFIHSFGSGNTFVGSGAGNFTLTPANAQLNTSIGASTLTALTDGAANCGMGYLSLNACTTGTGNTALGFEVLPQITTATGNTGAGENCLNSLLTGASYNTCYGSATLSGMTSGTNNIAIGYGTGQAYNAGQSHNILIGNSAVGLVGDANTTRIGQSGSGTGQQNRCFVAGIDGVDVGSTAKVVTMGTGGTVDQLGTATITAGTGISITPTANTITIAASGTTTLTYTNVNTSPYVVLTTDDYLSVDCSGGLITVELPNAATLGRIFVIKDRTGNAATNNITVTTVGGAVNIDGATTFVMNTAFESIEVIGNGSTYEIF